jgi:hypothetical protein
VGVAWVEGEAVGGLISLSEGAVAEGSLTGAILGSSLVGVVKAEGLLAQPMRMNPRITIINASLEVLPA